MNPSPSSRVRLAVAVLAALGLPTLAACGDDGATADTDAAAGGLDADTSGQRTLDTCTTTIAPAAPEFYQRYFRCVTITTSATGVTITTGNLPPHRSPYYVATDPNYVAFDARGGSYHKNPNTIAGQSSSITIPTTPTASGATINATTVDGMAGTSQEEYRGGIAGMAIDSVQLFSGTAAPGDDIAQERFTFDLYEGHPQMTGVYHYHSPTPGPLEALKHAGETTSTVPGSAEAELFGIMCDGTVILGCTELDGTAPPATLDAQGGHVANIVAHDGTTMFTARYHTHVCANAARGHGYTPEIHYYAACPR